MEENRSNPRGFLIILLVAGLLFVGFTQVSTAYSVTQLQQEPLSLPVPVVQQSRGTSCGEAAITIAYNYANPGAPINEQEVIEYAVSEGYFTEDLAPYTSPANMEKIARHYAGNVSTGNVADGTRGLALLLQRLRDGEPVIIDVLSDFTDPGSEAHFVVVTGASVDPERGDAVVVHFNNPLTGRNESADWAGDAGLWNAWQNNGDPGGSGWWLVIPPSDG